MNDLSATRRETLPRGRRWFHRLAVLLACVTLPLITVGGLVTTYDAGMAVPDWPSTYGYNLFLYPWQTWLSGPWDLFIEHGHRLLGATAGFVTIALVAAAWLGKVPRWQKIMACAALVLVIVQGVLGGMRVLLDERMLAMVHGCVGPAFFALGVALAVCSSPRWLSTQTSQGTTQAPFGLAMATALFAYTQLVLGALVRHVPVTAGPAWFRVAVMFHLVVAAVLSLHVLLLAWRSFRGRQELAAMTRTAYLLVVLLCCQVVLGCATWIVKFGWPAWMSDYTLAASYTIQNQSMLQAITVTAHVAMGSLILVTAVATALYAGRLHRWSLPQTRMASSKPQGAIA